MHLHYAIQPAGLIDGAKSFSIYKQNQAFYIIFTGPAARELKEARVRGLLMELIAKFIFNKIEERFDKKIKEAQSRIQESQLENYISEKNNQKVLFSDVQNITFSENTFKYPEVTLTLLSGEKRVFVFRSLSMDEVKAFWSLA